MDGTNVKRGVRSFGDSLASEVAGHTDTMADSDARGIEKPKHTESGLKRLEVVFSLTATHLITTARRLISFPSPTLSFLLANPGRRIHLAADCGHLYNFCSPVNIANFCSIATTIFTLGAAATIYINQLIKGGIRRRVRCLTYPTAPSLAFTPRESPCRLPSHTK